MSQLSPNFENMTVAEFEQRLPDLFANGHGRVSEDPGVQEFLRNNPTCAALVSDLEYIADVARDLFNPAEEDPSPNVWNRIQSELKSVAASEDPK